MKDTFIPFLKRHLFFFSFWCSCYLLPVLFSSKYLSESHRIFIPLPYITGAPSNKNVTFDTEASGSYICNSTVKVASTFHNRFLIFTYTFQPDVLWNFLFFRRNRARVFLDLELWFIFFVPVWPTSAFWRLLTLRPWGWGKINPCSFPEYKLQGSEQDKCSVGNRLSFSWCKLSEVFPLFISNPSIKELRNWSNFSISVLFVHFITF